MRMRSFVGESGGPGAIGADAIADDPDEADDEEDEAKAAFAAAAALTAGRTVWLWVLAVLLEVLLRRPADDRDDDDGSYETGVEVAEREDDAEGPAVAR